LSTTGGTAIAVDSGSVYWTNGWNVQNGSVMRAPVAGSAADIVASGQYVTGVYWTNTIGGTVMKAADDGGLALTIALGQSFTRYPPYGVGIAVDSDCVYWSDGGFDGHIMRVAK
jgi:hypothetical protein